MTRKLALFLAAFLGLVHGQVLALGLGEITVDSSLNQRFEAEVVLRNLDGLESNEIIANLASPEDFERVGVERFFYLSDLEFTTDLSDRDRPVVRVTSRRPITEPFLNFVVEVLWPSGRLLREYTVLLDPPTYADRPMTAPSAPAASSAPAPSRQSRPAAPGPQPAAADDGGRGAFVGDTYGVTDRNDTLWEIALQVRTDESLSVQQTMLALLRMNPEAFIGGNINRLKAGYVLRVPDADEVRRLSFDDAVVQVSEQNDRWRQGLDGAPLDGRNVVTDRSGAAASGGELRLVSAEERAAAGDAGARDASGSAAAAGGRPSAAAGGASRAELDAAEAEAESARENAAALSSELEAARTQLDELQRQVELKDERIAQMQQVLRRQQQEAEQQEPSTAPSPAPAPAPSASGPFGLSWTIIGAAVGGLVVLLVAGLLIARRRAGGDDGDVDEAMDSEVEKTQLMPAISAADLGDDGGDEEEQEDAIEQADLFLAYGRFSDAARVLRTATESEPNRADLRLKLMEVCAETGDVDGFNEHASALSSFADADTIAAGDVIAARLPGAMSSSGEITEGEVSAPREESAEGEVSLDFDLGSDDDESPADLDSLGLDLDESGAPEAESASADGDLDFDLDLDEEDPADDDGLALDLAGEEGGDAGSADDGGLDFDLEDADGGAAKTEAADEDLALDLDGDAEGDDADDGLALDLDGDDDDDDGGIDFDLQLEDDDAGAAPAKTEGGDDDFEIDDLADPGAAPEPAVAAAESSESSEGEGDDLDFDIDDLADAGGGADDEDDDSTLLLSDLEDDSDDDVTELLSSVGSDEQGGKDDTDEKDDADDDVTELLSTSGDDAGGDDDLDFDLDDDLDFGGDDGDEISTKLELARAYVDMGDEEGAREILDEVARDGDDGQKKEAGALLEQLG
jgi:pilus assembly protein FimV